jgi:flagellar hook protein FlgE
MPDFSIPLSGLTAESTNLSAVANNLANQNTTGYKTVRVLFRDLFYQHLGTTGADDPIQLGAGAQVQAMPGKFTQGNVESTGVPTDVAIQGDGFFIVEKDGTREYTRAGDFSVNKANFLITSDGQSVLGFPAVNGVVDSGGSIAPLQLGAGSVSPPVSTSSLSIHANLNAGANVGDKFSTPITIYDSLGSTHVATFTFTKTASNAWDYAITIPASEQNPTVPSGGGTPVPATGVLKSGTLAFNSNGVLTSPTGNVTGVTAAGLADGASDLTFDWDLFDGSTPILTQVAGASSASSTLQDGRASGSLVDFSIGSDGTVTGSFSNGRTAALGQLALASFADQLGLQRVGANNFVETLSSGQAVAGIPSTGGRGELSGGALELSNVDIATEFSHLIVAQRAFQADARVVTTFDEITQDTIALKR